MQTGAEDCIKRVSDAIDRLRRLQLEVFEELVAIKDRLASLEQQRKRSTERRTSKLSNLWASSYIPEDAKKTHASLEHMVGFTGSGLGLMVTHLWGEEEQHALQAHVTLHGRDGHGHVSRAVYRHHINDHVSGMVGLTVLPTWLALLTSSTSKALAPAGRHDLAQPHEAVSTLALHNMIAMQVDTSRDVGGDADTESKLVATLQHAWVAGQKPSQVLAAAWQQQGTDFLSTALTFDWNKPDPAALWLSAGSGLLSQQLLVSASVRVLPLSNSSTQLAQQICTHDSVGASWVLTAGTADNEEGDSCALRVQGGGGTRLTASVAARTKLAPAIDLVNSMVFKKEHSNGWRPQFRCSLLLEL